MESQVRDRAYKFALRIIKLCQILREQKEYLISDQLGRLGTSIGADIEEATAGQSRKDFIAKMSVASKEASRESNYWLRLLYDSALGPESEVKELIDESAELKKMLTSIVKTSTQNSKLKTQNF